LPGLPRSRSLSHHRLCPTTKRGVPRSQASWCISLLVLVEFGRQVADTSFDEFVATDNDAQHGARSKLEEKQNRNEKAALFVFCFITEPHAMLAVFPTGAKLTDALGKSVARDI